MNLALLAKQGWRIAVKEASLLGKFLKGIYYRSVRWRVGDEKEMDIWKDPWIPRLTEYTPHTSEVDGYTRVAQLISEGQWYEELLSRLFGEDDKERIVSIPLSKFHVLDKLV
ncbi:hypothetical protein LIER_42819 [Lithospermum erythrorhizon]|uniref:Uncharacterized protein n=1 Tax=Lithospermum erythrorhizon TaxID=34254 RepID=A0AAV3P1U0_LITER